MKIKKWLFSVNLTTTLLLIIAVSMMYWSDTYSVIHTDRTHFYTEPNTRVLRMDYLLHHKDKYDSFIFGSSRVASINPLKLKNGRYYNMTYSEGIPHEHLVNIRLLLKSKVKIKNLLIGLDDFSPQVSFQKHNGQGLTKLHYLALEENRLAYLRDYFFRFPQAEDRSHIAKKIQQSNEFFMLDVSQQSKMYAIQEDNQYFKSSAHLNNPLFKKPIYYVGNERDNTINDIKKIKEICLQNKIDCRFFINPLHHTSYASIDKKSLALFKKALSKTVDYYDFSHFEEISNNNYYWLDTSHYRKIVGDMIIDRMYNQKNLTFGNHIALGT